MTRISLNAVLVGEKKSWEWPDAKLERGAKNQDAEKAWDLDYVPTTPLSSWKRAYSIFPNIDNI